MVQTGKPADPRVRATTSSGNGLMRPLEDAANKVRVEILLEHRMTETRQSPNSGRLVGVGDKASGKNFNIRARKAVIVATGGSTGNVNFRRMFDLRLTEEYCSLAGMPWSTKTPNPACRLNARLSGRRLPGSLKSRSDAACAKLLC